MSTKNMMRKVEFRTLSRERFKEIRVRLGLSQAGLARVLGYRQAMRISELERETNPLPVPWVVGQLMLAMNEGYRPETFAENPFEGL